MAFYREKASGARADRPKLLRLIADLQPGEVVIGAKIDRISRLPFTRTRRDGSPGGSPVARRDHVDSICKRRSRRYSSGTVNG
ncbi:recombinase family protein [Sinorhizobium numidicum]|uniref:recombinase family protein n=1 Tax=Sinorhizobium numidicum TaxID=680248 RepID=UPI003CC8D6F3